MKRKQSTKSDIKSAAGNSLVKSDLQFPVVGIGASAGGLDAFKKLIKAIPEKSGMAYVLVQHLSPKHESLLPSLLQKVTSLPVVEISNDIKLKPDVVYVIPSNKMLIANDGVLQLTARPSGDKIQRNPIDLFFTSLALVHQAHAIGVVLSGLAMDGTQGLKAIKENGGLAFAQDDESAQYKEMPHNAVQSGVIDFILAPEKIPEKIMELVSSARLINLQDPNEEHTDSWFKKIIHLIRIKKGTDFTYYKQTTVRRRILRRMALSKFSDLAAYHERLSEHRDEIDILYQDLLIPVSEFFRDQATFDYLASSVIPEIVNSKSSMEPIRIWVAGCSTGQEAYSLAICLREHMGQDMNRVQIFASDISEQAINIARAGVYSKSDVVEVSQRRLSEFFTKMNGTYHVNQSIRDVCVFAVHNFLKDPPFGKQDLISCRNVMIYMEPFLQKKVFTTFHYALNQKGLLLLGKSENVTLVKDLFSVLSKNDKVYRKKLNNSRTLPVLSQANERTFQGKRADIRSVVPFQDFQKSAEQLLLNKYSPVGVVINESLDIVHFKGNTSAYLEPSPGKPTVSLLKMAKAGLAFELRSLIHKAKKEKGHAIKERIAFGEDDDKKTVTIEAIRLPNTLEHHYLILFNKVTEEPPLKSRKTIKGKTKTKHEITKDAEIKKLRMELAQLREDVMSITQDQEASNEELQSSNEELLSSSEELQSLNEELETSKEELQSSLEELSTVNQELTGLNDLLANAKSFAEAIVSTVAHPILILDAMLRVKSANKTFYSYFGTHEAETEGRLIFDLGNGQWDDPTLRKHLESLLPDKKMFFGFEVTHLFPLIGTRTLLLNARELGQNLSPERMILIAFDDITEQRDLSIKLEHAVITRTNELTKTNMLLAQSNRELKKANTELESFTYVASHDLQEPLRKIQTFSSRILEDESQHLSETGMDFFKRIQMSSKRMQALINDLLSFSRLSTNDRAFEKIHLRDIVLDVLNDLKETIDEKHAVVEVNKVCEVNIIRFQFRQLMYNLISNALKFSQPNIPPIIIIESSTIDGAAAGPLSLTTGKEYCRISITDNGIGFEPQYNERIFEVFQRLHGKEYEGTGIGLAIAKKIVENHGGVITATGILQKGTVFNVYLPLT